MLKTWREWRKILKVKLDDFRWGFLHNLPEDEQRRVYDAQVILTRGRKGRGRGSGDRLARASTVVEAASERRSPMSLLAPIVIQMLLSIWVTISVGETYISPPCSIAP